MIPDKRTYSGTVQAIETGVITSKARRDMVTVLRTLMLQHTTMPDSIHYNAVCEALVTKFPNLADEEDDSGYVSTCNKGDTWKSAIAKHQWDQQHQVDWDATRVLDRATRPVQLKVKEALHLEKTPANNRLNRDGG